MHLCRLQSLGDVPLKLGRGEERFKREVLGEMSECAAAPIAVCTVVQPLLPSLF